MNKLIKFIVLCMILVASIAPVRAQTENVQIQMLDSHAAKTTRLVDGNRIQLLVKLPSKVTLATDAAFVLEGMEASIATCSLPSGADTCTSEPFSALGWYWNPGGVPQPSRAIHVLIDGQPLPGAQEITIKPRPVVMVHGFLSNWETWKSYLGPGGYLASIGLQGFAVGDGQAPGVLNTGDPSNPAGRTNSIAQNAEVLKGYIAAVQQKTGAEKVDLLVHSMGGMITRYYLDRVMDSENVAQVIFLGTPMAGSACVYPVAALGYLMPASLEILPDYMVNIFNRQVVHRHGIPFYMIAGTLLIEPLTSPCATAPSDTVVAFDSATAVQLEDVQQFPIYHGNLTSEKQVFDNNVMHLLQNLPDSFGQRPDLEAPIVTATSDQFSRTYTGHLQPGESEEVTINIDPDVSLANFNLYDSSRSLEIEVRGANGNVIALDPVRNGVIKFTDPAMMLYLGYGFKQPKPGKWVIKLKTTDQTLSQGADYSIDARFVGGAILSARTNPTILTQGQTVSIDAQIQLQGAGLVVESAIALIRAPDGTLADLPLNAKGTGYSAEYRPKSPGLYSVEVRLVGTDKGGFGVDRAAFLTFEVQPGSDNFGPIRTIAVVILLCVVLLLLGLVMFFFFFRYRSKSG